MAYASDFATRHILRCLSHDGKDERVASKDLNVLSYKTCIFECLNYFQYIAYIPGSSINLRCPLLISFN